MSDTIACASHGQASVSFCCVHLAEGSGLGVIHGGTDAEPAAICERCDSACSGDWASINTSDIKAVCVFCFWELVGKNERQPAPLTVDWESAAVDEMHHRNLERQTRLFADYPKYWYDLDQKQFYLQTGSGVSKWSMPLELIGSFHEEKKSWAWAWENDSLPQGVRASSNWLKGQIELVRAHSLIQSRPTGLAEAWHLALKAGWLWGASSVYRVPHGPLHIFLRLGEETAEQ